MPEDFGPQKISVKMLKTMPGSEDGCEVKIYEEGQYYFMDRSLANVFIENEWAQRRVRKLERVEKEKAEAIIEVKEEKPKEENLSKPPSIQDSKPREWIGRTLRAVETGELKMVESARGNQIFFEGEDEGVDYRTVRKTMEAI